MIDPAETQVAGNWVVEDGQVRIDEGCVWVEPLTKTLVRHICDLHAIQKEYTHVEVIPLVREMVYGAVSDFHTTR